MLKTLAAKFQSRSRMGAVLACGLWFLAASPAHAYTDCYGTVSMVYVQNGQVYIDTPGMVGYTQGYTEAQNAKFQSMAMAAFLSGKRVGLRFAADGVNCSVRTARGDLFALLLVN
jgi:hypothetical protein